MVDTAGGATLVLVFSDRITPCKGPVYDVGKRADSMLVFSDRITPCKGPVYVVGKRADSVGALDCDCAPLMSKQAC